MKELSKTKSAARPVGVGRIGLMAVAAPAWLALAVVTGCGSSGNDISCGKGTTQQGSTCVAKAPITTTPDASEGGSSGATGSGGSTAASSGGKGGTGAGGSAEAGVTDAIVFGGATAVAPATPANAGAAASLLVTWKPASYPVYPNASIHYDVFSATSAGNESYGAPPILSAPPGSTSILVDSLPATPSTYYFVVRAVSDLGDAKDTNTVEQSGKLAVDGVAPTFGGAKTATPLTSSSVLVSWDAATDNLTPAAAIIYRVFWSSVAGGAEQLGAVTNPGDTSAEVRGLGKAETAFFFRVEAVDAAGNVNPATSSVVTGSTGKDTTPPQFSGCKGVLSPTASGGTVIWDAATDDTTPSSGITYNIYAFDTQIDHDTTFNAPVASFKGTTSGLVTTLLPGSTYRIICRAEDTSNNEDKNREAVLLQTTDDSSPPTFVAGAASLNAGSTSIDFTWPQAHDDQTADAAIRYLIFGSTVQGGEDLTSPIFTWTGSLGTTLMKTDLLKALPTSDGGEQKVSGRAFYFVIKAEDEAGNQSVALPELDATTLVSFADDVQPVFTLHCALAGCHVHATPLFNPPQGQVLEENYSYDSIVNVVAKEGQTLSPPEPNIKRIDGTTSDPTQSYIWRKINGGTVGHIAQNRMPPPQTTGPQLRMPQDFDIIESWITQGALRN